MLYDIWKQLLTSTLQRNPVQIIKRISLTYLEGK